VQAQLAVPDASESLALPGFLQTVPCTVCLASADASYISGQVLHPNGGTVVGS
jgi:hypothetical protein